MAKVGRDGEPPWQRQLLVGVAALAVVALVIGGLVSVVALGAVRVSGLGSTSSRPTERASLYIPSGTPSTGSGGDAQVADGGSSAGPSASSSPTKAKRSTKAKAKPAITLQVYPGNVAPGGRINFSGRYPDGSGKTLQIQRFEAGRWTSFPVTVPVGGELFTTYITTQRTGRQRFRVADVAGGQHSNAVRVTVG